MIDIHLPNTPTFAHIIFKKQVYSVGDDPKKLVEVYNHFTFMKAKLTVSFINLDGKPMELKVKGDYFDRSATVTLDGVVIARVDRRFMNAGELLFDQQTYYLTVAPNGTWSNVCRAPM